MNRNEFLSMMENASSIDPKLTSDIGEIVAIFPYFQSAHLLLLKGLQQNSDVRFSNQLKASSMHICDREVLYHYLYTPETRNEVRSAEPAVKIDEEKTADPVTGEDVNQTVIESPNSEQLINEFEKESVSNDEEETIVPEPVMVAGLIDSVEADERVEAEKTELLELDLDKNGLKEEVTDSVAGLEAVETPVNLSQADLIDRFIIANPRIEPSREKKDIVQEDKSIPIYEEGVFVTETLARIYISQGYYSKAIEIFEKLSLKYPEKSSYFATQIEKVKEFLKK